MKHETLTKCSSNKGFSGNSNILSRSNFGDGKQESSPPSLTAATLKPLAFMQRKPEEAENPKKSRQ